MAAKRRGAGANSDQMAFSFGPPTGAPPDLPPSQEADADQVFFALVPEPEDAQRLVDLGAAIDAQNDLRGSVRPAQVLHVSLNALGDHSLLDSARLDAARRAAAKVAMPALKITYDTVSSFGGGNGRRPCVVRSGERDAAVFDLFCALDDALAREGVATHGRGRFEPHMTLLYGRRLYPEQTMAPLSWTARRVALIHSHVGKTFHERLGEWELRG